MKVKKKSGQSAREIMAGGVGLPPSSSSRPVRCRKGSAHQYISKIQVAGVIALKNSVLLNN